MPPVAVITDTDASLPPDLAALHGIHQVPINIHFGQETFRSGIDITMIGLDVTHRARLTIENAEQLRPTGRAGAFVAGLLDFFVANYRRRMGFDGAPIHDALAVAHVIRPDLVKTEHFAVEIDTTDGPSAGRTLVDRYHVTGREPNARVGTSVDSERFAGLLLERIASLD